MALNPLIARPLIGGEGAPELLAQLYARKQAQQNFDANFELEREQSARRDAIEQQRSALYGQQIEQMRTAAERARRQELEKQTGAALQAASGNPSVRPGVSMFLRKNYPDLQLPEILDETTIPQIAGQLGLAGALPRQLNLQHQTLPGGDVAVWDASDPDPDFKLSPGPASRMPPNEQKVTVKLPDGMLQDMWLAPGQDPSQGRPIGDPYTGIKDAQIATIEDRMANNFRTSVGPYEEAMNSADSVAQLAEMGAIGNRRLNASEQQALIFLFGKVLDPSSVLREGEYDRIASSRGYYDTVKNYQNKVISGDILTPAQVRNIAEIAKFYKQRSLEVIRGKAKNEVERARKRHGVDPSMVVSDPRYYNFETEAGPAAPKPGASDYLNRVRGGK